MKTHRISWLLLAGLAVSLSAPLAYCAEEGSAPEPGKHKRQFGKGGPGGPGGGFLESLTPEEKQKFMAAREKALADDPALAKEDEELKGMREQVKSGTMSREDAMAKMKAHHEKMNAAMVKADPSVEPIIEKMKSAMKERFGGKKGPPPQQ